MPSTSARQDALNDALERLSGYRFFEGIGFACHGPMGAEALSTLGYDHLVASWIENHKQTHPAIAAPPAGERIDLKVESSWRPVLGDASRISDWAAAFAEELNTQPWEDVLRRWAPVLIPGHAGGFTHGLLRVAHAVRAMPNDAPPTPLMLEELSRGLGMWAASYTVVPGQAQPGGQLRIAAAIEGLPRPTEPWNIFEAGSFSRIGELAGFDQAVDALSPLNSTGDAISDLSEAFCQAILASAGVVPVPLVHTVTPLAALRTLMPYLPGVTTDAIYPQFWQVGAAILAGFTPQPLSIADTDPSDADGPTPAELAERAAEHGDAHAIKFTEAALREHAIHPSGAYLHAARAILDRIPPA